jgi:hypothetical protein
MPVVAARVRFGHFTSPGVGDFGFRDDVGQRLLGRLLGGELAGLNAGS